MLDYELNVLIPYIEHQIAYNRAISVSSNASTLSLTINCEDRNYLNSLNQKTFNLSYSNNENYIINNSQIVFGTWTGGSSTLTATLYFNYSNINNLNTYNACWFFDNLEWYFINTYNGVNIPFTSTSLKNEINTHNENVSTIASMLTTQQTTSYEQGFNSGRTLGYKEGYKSGDTNGYSVGYKEGYNVGYDNKGESTITSIFTSMSLGLKEVMSIEILPKINVGLIISIPISFLLISIVWKIFKGGD